MTDWQNSILTGDVRHRLADIPESSIHCVMTSPPYWQLRDYGEPDQLGLEDTPEAFVDNLAAVFDEVQRVLRPDGSLWLNLGDTYDDKDLQQIPARVALELQARGWTLRNRVTWAKPNPMPNSVKDRLNTTTEAIFHLTPAPDYWYDLDAIREPHSEAGRERRKYDESTAFVGENHTPVDKEKSPKTNDESLHPVGKNPGDVFEVATKPFADAHFAVYPPELCEKPIKATCPPKVCSACGTPYEREVEREPGKYDYSDRGDRMDGDRGRVQSSGTQLDTPGAEFKGWTQPCDCDTDATEPGITLDPFAGAGTTLLKAKELGRRFVGIELNPEYADMARARVGLSPRDPSNVRENDDPQGLEAWTDGGDEA